MDPAPLILVWRRKLHGGDQILEIADGKGWRLPRANEIGLRRSRIDGDTVQYLAEAPYDFDPGRTHRWVTMDANDEVIRHAFAQAGAAVIVWRRAGGGRVEVLVLHRAHEGPDYEGDWAWTPPGGALDPGESHLECAQRELYEEAGIDLVLERVPGDGFAIFAAEADGSCEIVLSDEHDRFEWMTVDLACERCRPEQVPESIRRALAHTGVMP